MSIWLFGKIDQEISNSYLELKISTHLSKTHNNDQTNVKAWEASNKDKLAAWQ